MAQVRDIAFSPNESRVAVTSGSLVYIYDTASSERLLRLAGHTSQVSSVDYSSDGLRLLTAAADRTAKVWNALTGEEILTISPHTEGVADAAFSPDDESVVTVTSKSLGTPPMGSLQSELKLWNGLTGEMIRTFTRGPDGPFEVEFSPDGKHILALNMWIDRGAERMRMMSETTLWNAATGEIVWKYSQLGFTIRCIAFSPDGSRIATGGAVHDLNSKERTTDVIVLDASTGEEIDTFRIADARFPVEDMEYSPDGTRIVLVTWADPSIRLLDSNTGREIRRFHSTHLSAEGVSKIGFLRQGKMIFASGGIAQLIEFWNVDGGERSGEIVLAPTPVARLTAAAFTRDGRSVLTGFYDGSVRMWNKETGELEKTLRGHTKRVKAFAFSPDGRWLVSGSQYYDEHQDASVGEAILWDLASGEAVRTLEGAAFDVGFTPDGGEFQAADGYQTRFYDLETGRLIRTFRPRRFNVSGYAILSPNGKDMLMGGFDKALYLWDTRTGDSTKIYSGAVSSPWAVEFSPDGETVVYRVGNSVVMVEADSGRILETLPRLSSSATSLAVSFDGKKILVGCNNGSVTLYDRDAGEFIATFLGHVRAIAVVAFSSDGTEVLTGASDGTAKLWAIPVGRVSEPGSAAETRRKNPSRPIALSRQRGTQ